MRTWGTNDHGSKRIARHLPSRQKLSKLMLKMLLPQSSTLEDI